MSITKKLVIAAALSGAVLAPSLSMAQTAGATVLGVSETVLADVVSGWSVKRTILNKAVYNYDAKPAKVGKIEDVIIAPTGSVSYAIINSSAFMGLSNHRVAIPVEQFKIEGDRITLPGGRIHQRRQGRDLGAPDLRAVDVTHQVLRLRQAPPGQHRRGERRVRTTAIAGTHDRAQRRQPQRVAAPLIAEQVPPAARPRRTARGIGAIGH